MNAMLPEMEIIMPQQALGNVPAFLAKLWKMVDNPETGMVAGPVKSSFNREFLR